MRRLLYGGTFDPVHIGHIQVAEAAGRELGADRVSLLPAAQSPHKPGGPIASDADRLAMLELAIADHPLLDILTTELERGGVSYTIDTIQQLRRGACRGDSLLWLIGQDSLADLPAWHRARELAALIPFAVVPRPGAAEPDWPGLEGAIGEKAVAGMKRRWLRTPRVDVSSSDLRLRRREGRSVRCRVPDPVADYIESRGLYAAADSPPDVTSQ